MPRDGIKISQAEVDAFLESIPSATRSRHRPFTPLEDAKILAVWEHGKNKAIAAKAIGVSETTMRARYRELIEERK